MKEASARTTFQKTHNDFLETPEDNIIFVKVA